MPRGKPFGTSVVLHPFDSKAETKTFSFDRAYWSAKPGDAHYISQETLMQDLGVELRNNALEGYNSCLFAYGQTGSGKTFSVLGNDSPCENRGLLPRIVEDIFMTIEDLKDDPNDSSTFTTSVSYLEIYNEQIRDLLASESEMGKKLEVRNHPKVGTFVQGIKDVPVFAWQDVKGWLDFGVQARAVASTVMNATSSRSHCIFTLEIARTVTKPSGKTIQLRSKVNLVDLAGSERQKKTQATGSRLKEGAMINQSLSNLALVISRLADMAKIKENKGKTDKKKMSVLDFVPFRNSKLTYLLMDSLNGNSKTVMIAALSPAFINYEETLSTLMFAQSVKAVKTNAKKNEQVEDNLKEELEAECRRLRQLVESGAGHKQQELAALEELAKKYGRDFETQLKLAGELKEQRQHLLDDAGLTSTEMSTSVGLDSSTPHLLNVCYDPELNGCLIYFLEKGVTFKIGYVETKNKSVDKRRKSIAAPPTTDQEKNIEIPLTGLGIVPNMFEVSNLDDRSLTLRYNEGRVLLNGRQVKDEERLQHNDRIIVGHAFCFRLVIPEEAKEAVISDMHGENDIERWMDEIHMEEDAAYQQCLFYSKELATRIGETRATAFTRSFHKVCRLVHEANELVRTVHPKERLHFSAEVLTDLFGSECEVPECIVRLKKLETGKARWRSFVKQHILQSKTRSFMVTLDHMRLNLPVQLEPDHTVLLMNRDDFARRMQYSREVCKAILMQGPEVLQDMPHAERECWGPIPPWIAAELEQEKFERELHLKEELGEGKSEKEKLLEDELETMRKLLETKDRRIRALELAGPRPPGRRPSSFLEDSRNALHQANGSAPGLQGTTAASLPASTREEAHYHLLGQVKEMVDARRKRQSEESQALEKHIQDLNLCNDTYFEKLRSLRAEVRSQQQDLEGPQAS
eukprot:TRINITY_DN28694_c0_g1_i1.p1 TRINITY_DN28694_c0_g1~~TRINITY_DN28694_c0_g1_i1.p1  ORF type:complete len:991 (-),score=232.42 TRINITY_DN28694_c0_g1_i1:40-2790(-)